MCLSPLSDVDKLTGIVTVTKFIELQRSYTDFITLTYPHKDTRYGCG